ncbi:hypothetical protein K2Z83_20740 [Oscillochloris sp. ZM17-4]|uniref:Mom family adenine methylcarbamoylation protein n=1 Tax=Oscillochloris sp. ZM17-4 TaxID=2866714 RepID=UPI001C72CAE0|nr:hypothetical protein [Oscillochloris sp. ZM17-4]MBX0330099.1 hypothetical protein [Oscillochloris sp. ZM17-4]
MHYRIDRVRGGTYRAEVEAYIAQNHYMRSSGGSGQLFAVVRDDDQVVGACLIGATASQNQNRSLVGACLIGPTASADAERSIAQPGVLVRQIKRSFLSDDVPTSAMYESQLLRHSMQAVCDEYDQPVLFVSYADPAATDARTGQPLAGWIYLAAGFFYVGTTSSTRRCVIDHQGRARSTRQGAVTLTRNTLPKAGSTFHGEAITADWRMATLPPARIWVAVTTPTRFTRRQAKHAWRTVFAAINLARRVAARTWISHTTWRRKLAGGTVTLGEPRPQHLRRHDRFQPALWRGGEITRTSAPVWVPLVHQQRALLFEDVAGETVAGRVYAPLAA